MSIDDRLDRLRTELDEEVSDRVRTPAYADIVGRHVRRRRTRLAAGGAAVVIVAGGVLGGVLATVPGGHPKAVPPAEVSVLPPPSSSIQGGPFTSAPPPGSSEPTVPVTGQTYPSPGASYVVVPDGSQFVWTDLQTGAHGHFGPLTGQVSLPSVSADGRRVAFVEAGGVFGADAHGIAVWDLDSGTAMKIMTGDIETSVAISPDGTKVLWNEHGVVRLANVGEPSSVQSVEMSAGPAAWVGNEAIAYLTPPAVQSGSAGCTVMRLDLSAGHATRCLLPTATLKSAFAPDGSTWQITSVSGAGDSGLLALVLGTPDNAGPVTMAVAMLDPSAEATPFHVLASTVTNPLKAVLGFEAVLVDQGSRVVYGVRGANAVTEIFVAPVAGGSPSTVMTAGDGMGLGAPSG